MVLDADVSVVLTSWLWRSILGLFRIMLTRASNDYGTTFLNDFFVNDPSNKYFC